MSNVREVRSGWVSERIDEVARLNPSREGLALDQSSLVHFVPMAAVEEEFGGIDVTMKRPLHEVAKGYTVFRPDDVIFAKITPCMENGKLAVIPNLEHGWAFGSTEFHVLRSSKAVRPRWLAFFLSQSELRRHAQRSMTGSAGQLRVPLTWLSEQIIPIAPLVEQDRVIAKIDELFYELDAGVESLERIQNKLKRFRASVLEAAIGGRLVSNHATPRIAALGELIDSLGQGWSPKCEPEREPLDDEWAIIKTTAVQPMLYQGHECKALPAKMNSRSHLEIMPGDILMTRKGRGGRAGVTCLVRSTRRHNMVCDTVYRFRCKNSVIQPEYLEIALNAPTVLAQIYYKKTGNVNSGVNLTHSRLSEITIPVPPLQTQKEIVEVVAQRLSISDSIEVTILNNLKRAARLRQGILKRAFEGRLVPQDPNDEPAERLLARIRDQRQPATPSTNGSARSRGRGQPLKGGSTLPLFAQDDGDDP